MTRLGANNKRLSGDQLRTFREALLAAFDTIFPFDMMMKERLERDRQQVALGDDMTEIVFKVIRRAENEAWSRELLIGARDFRPHDPDLIAFAQEFGAATQVYLQEGESVKNRQFAEHSGLEKFIIESNGMKDVSKWRERLGQLEGQVCRIEIPVGNKTETGTGFLLGSSVVITNYHVVSAGKRKLVDPANVILRFDYRQLSDGFTVNAGAEYCLAADWLIDSSPVSRYEFNDGEPQPDELDYALLRVDGTPGKDLVGGSNMTDPSIPPRGWIALPTMASEFIPDTPLFILQHPKDAPLKMTLDTNAIIGLNFNGTRVRYRTNTDEGSSGSPCFDDNWNLVALHHLGDPAFNPEKKPLFNQGIPFKAIIDLIKLRNKDYAIGI